MELLNENQVNIVADCLAKLGVNYAPLTADLLDHVCTMVEIEMEKGLDFKTSLNNAIQSFGVHEFSKTQELTIYLITLKNRNMRKFSGITGIVSASLIILGVVFKVNHLIGANFMLFLGICLTGIVVLPLMAMLSITPTDSTINKISTLVGFGSAILLTISAGFKILHWPYANIIYGTGFIVLTFGFMPLYLLKSYKIAENKLFSIAKVLLIVAGISVFWGLLPKVTPKAHLSHQTESQETK